MSHPAVTDSTCLIGLERIQRLDILPQIFSPVMVPLAVQVEVGITTTLIALNQADFRISIALVRRALEIAGES